MATIVGELKATYSARGSVSYSIEAYHQGLHKHRLVRGPDAQVVTAKVRLQSADWDALWAKKVAAERQVTKAYQAKEEAAARTADAQRALQALRDVLASSLSDSKAVDWEALKDRTPFPTPVPTAPMRYLAPQQDPISDAPSRTSPRYRLNLSFFDKVIKSRRIAKENWIRRCSSRIQGSGRRSGIGS